MNNKPIVIVWGEPNSIFSEIFIKSIKKYEFKKTIILIGSYKLFLHQAKKLKLNFNEKLLNKIDQNLKNLKRNKINFLNVNFEFIKPFESISNKSSDYINECFTKAFKILKKVEICGLINGPISKKNFLKKKYYGVTEYIADKFNQKKIAMLIFNKKLSVCPLTTHIPLSQIGKFVTKKNILEKIKIIDDFYKKKLKIKPNIAVTGLNPHCETISKYNEDEKIVMPAVKLARKNGISVFGPFSADTIFLKQNRKKFNIILGMYHDQVLTPLKTLYEYDAINITIGMPFLRLSPDHGPNSMMVGKNKSNSLSFKKILKFLDNI